MDWTYEQSRGVWMVQIHPTNSDILYAATTEGIYKSIYVLEGVVEIEACADGAGNAKELHHRLCAVEPGPDRDTLSVQNGANIVRMDLSKIEAEDSCRRHTPLDPFQITTYTSMKPYAGGPQKTTTSLRRR